MNARTDLSNLAVPEVYFATLPSGTRVPYVATASVGHLADLARTVAAQWPHLKRSMGVVLDNPDERLLVWHEHAAIARFILAGDAQQLETLTGEVTVIVQPEPASRRCTARICG